MLPAASVDETPYGSLLAPRPDGVASRPPSRRGCLHARPFGYNDRGELRFVRGAMSPLKNMERLSTGVFKD